MAVIPTWPSLAACLGQTHLFYPEADDASSTKKAMAICAGCKVRAECFDHAMSTNEPEGIWGGVTAKGRRRIRRGISI